MEYLATKSIIINSKYFRFNGLLLIFLGIGYETALDFAKRGAKVILGCRDGKKAEQARLQIIEETDNPNIFVKIIDMSSFASVRSFARNMYETENRLDILVNNAGICFSHGEKSEDGFELVMQVNYYSHFLLTNLLISINRNSSYLKNKYNF